MIYMRKDLKQGLYYNGMTRLIFYMRKGISTDGISQVKSLMHEWLEQAFQ